MKKCSRYFHDLLKAKLTYKWPKKRKKLEEIKEDKEVVVVVDDDDFDID